MATSASISAVTPGSSSSYSAARTREVIEVCRQVWRAEPGVTTLTVRPVTPDRAERLRLLERLRGLVDRL